MSLVLHVDDEIRRPLPAARLQLCICLHARKVICQPNTSIECTFFHKLTGRNTDLASDRLLLEIGLVVHNDLIVVSRNNREVHNTVLKVLWRKIGKCDKISLRAQMLCELIRLCLKFRECCVLMSVRCKHIFQFRRRQGILSRERIACNPYALLGGHARRCSKGRRCTGRHCQAGDKKDTRRMFSNTLHARSIPHLILFHQRLHT